MKRLISILLSLFFMLSLVACYNNTTDTDTQLNTQLDNTTDLIVDDKITESTIVLERKHNRYFERISPTPLYLHDDIANEKGAYKIIETYEEYASCVGDASFVDSGLFENNSILIIKDYGSNMKAVREAEFLVNKKITLDVEVLLAEPTSTAEIPSELSVFYLIIPKEYFPENSEKYGVLEIAYNRLKGYFYASDTTKDLKIDFEYFEKNKAAIFTEKSDYDNFLKKVKCDASSPTLIMNNNEYPLVFYYEMQAWAGEEVFKDFYIDGNVVYLTLERYDCYLQSEAPSDTYFVGIPNEALAPANLPQNPMFNITIVEYYN